MFVEIILVPVCFFCPCMYRAKGLPEWFFPRRSRQWLEGGEFEGYLPTQNGKSGSSKELCQEGIKSEDRLGFNMIIGECSYHKEAGN